MIGQVFAGLAVFSLALIAIVCAIERGARLKDKPRDETLGVDQHRFERKAALPFQVPAPRGPKGFDARRPFVDRGIDRDGQRRRELLASVNTPKGPQVH